MRPRLRTIVLAGALAVVGVFGAGATESRAQVFGGRGFSLQIGSGNFGYGAFPGYGYYGGGYPGFGGYSRGYGYYGMGGHDFSPHWHRTSTPFGQSYWYGNGAHDFYPHQHSYSPYSGYRGYSVSPYGVTESFYGGAPYQFMPW